MKKSHSLIRVMLSISFLIIYSCIYAQKTIKDNSIRRPNIILVITDDQRWDALGAMGNKIIQTPNLDKLADNGMLFKNAYVTTSICMVSRASILTGQYQSRHKINDFSTDLSQDALLETYPILLKKEGYNIGYINKYGVGHENQPADLFDYWTVTNSIQPDYEMVDKKGDFIHNTDNVNNDIQDFLEKFGDKGPFCLSIGFKAPHEQDGHPPEFIYQSRFKELYEDMEIPMPETANPKYWERFPDFFRTEQNIARIRWNYLFSTNTLYQQNVKNYYRLITGVDEVIGQMMSKLEALGIADNTVIIFMSDNGFYLGEHGLEGKWYGHEESIRIPLIISDPRGPNNRKGVKPSQIVLNIDIAPTILALAGVEIPNRIQGNNIFDFIDNKIPERKSFFYEHTFMGAPHIPKVEGVVTSDFKYMRYIEYEYEELYDIESDPQEKLNLAELPSYKNKLEELRQLYRNKKKAAQ